MNSRNSIIGKTDWGIVLLYFALVLIGWFSIYASVYDEAHPSILDMSQVYGKQLIWIGAAVAVGFVILLIDAKFFNAFAFWIYILVILCLVAVLIYGKTTKGATSWINLGGGMKFQPSEFAKFATALALASYLGRLDTDWQDKKTQLTAYCIVFIPAALVLLQNDTGSAMVFASFVLVLYREGMSGLILVIALVAAVLFIFTLLFSQLYMYIILAAVFTILLIYSVRKKKHSIRKLVVIFAFMNIFVFATDFAYMHVLQEHQRSRIEVLLGQKKDLKGAGYNVNQSKIAIGSGGFWGKGFLKGTQTKYDFVPEQHTDFIFCTIGEEGGFKGSLVLIGLYLALLIRIIILAERQRSAFSRIYGYAIAGIIFFHFAINIAMTIGLMPVIGIPLPFLSYGGSSLLAFTIMLAVFVKQDANRLNIL
jgi:rod shape-determining protein RodA